MLLSNKRDWVTAALGFSAGILFVGGMMAARWFIPVALDIRDNRANRRARDLELAPLVEQAGRSPAAYESAEPGKVVDWCVDHLSHEVSYLNGKPSQPVNWTNESEVPTNGSATSGGRCVRMLARVASRSPRGVTLTFLGTP